MIETLDGFKIGDFATIVEQHCTPHVVTTRLTLDDFVNKKRTVYPLIYFEPILIDSKVLKDWNFIVTELTDDKSICTYKCNLLNKLSETEHISIIITLEGIDNENSNILIYNDDEVKISLPIKYVHEFQHILDLCGLEQFEKSLTISEMNQEYISSVIKEKYKDWDKWKNNRDNG